MLRGSVEVASVIHTSRRMPTVGKTFLERSTPEFQKVLVVTARLSPGDFGRNHRTDKPGEHVIGPRLGRRAEDG